jgi:hypothetical protein
VFRDAICCCSACCCCCWHGVHWHACGSSSRVRLPVWWPASIPCPVVVMLVACVLLLLLQVAHAC